MFYLDIQVIELEEMERYNTFLHYTNYEALTHILLDGTLKFNNLKNVNDKGLLLVKGKNKTVVEYSLSGYQNPIGVAEWQNQIT